MIIKLNDKGIHGEGTIWWRDYIIKQLYNEGTRWWEHYMVSELNGKKNYICKEISNNEKNEKELHEEN